LWRENISQRSGRSRLSSSYQKYARIEGEERIDDPLDNRPYVTLTSSRAAIWSEVKALAFSAPIDIFICLAALLVVQSIAALRDGYRFLRYVRRSLIKPPSDFTPPAAVIIPCKGIDPDFELNFTRFLAQDYPSYKLILVVASENDPAHRAIEVLLDKANNTKAQGLHFAAKTELVVAGFSEVRGEKVNNLLRGLTAVDPSTEIIVCADADARPHEDWLRSLVAPLADPKVTVSTGFRWYLPGRGFVSQLRAAWDTSIATLLGEQRSNFAWGGSMAMRAEDFNRLDIAGRYWAHTVSDDYAVTRAVRDAAGWIRFEPRCLVASRDDSTFREFLKWSNRQIILTRVYAPRLWKLGLAAHGLYCSTFLLGLGLLASNRASLPARIGIAAVLLAIVGLGLAKGRIRTIVARATFPEERPGLSRYGARYWQLSPLVPWVMLFNFLAAGLTRRIEWRGTCYELRSANEVSVIRREPS
jgi:ceramide glucosyltransferase